MTSINELYEAYLLGCEDECIPEPKSLEEFSRTWNGTTRMDAPEGGDERAIQKAFQDGFRALKTLLIDELDKPDASMKHEHNPDVRKDAQWEYCWRCRIEKVLAQKVSNYHELQHWLERPPHMELIG